MCVCVCVSVCVCVHARACVLELVFVCTYACMLTILFHLNSIGDFPYFLLFVINTGVFPSAWYANVREIAAKSPLLLSMGAEQFLDKELEINHPLKIENIAPVSIILFVIRTVVFLVCRYVQCHALLLVYRLRPPYNFLRSMPLDPSRWCTCNCTLSM